MNSCRLEISEKNNRIMNNEQKEMRKKVFFKLIFSNWSPRTRNEYRPLTYEKYTGSEAHKVVSAFISYALELQDRLESQAKI